MDDAIAAGGLGLREVGHDMDATSSGEGGPRCPPVSSPKNEFDSAQVSSLGRRRSRHRSGTSDFEAFSGARFHAHEGTSGDRLNAHPVQVLFRDAQASVEAERPEPLSNHGGTRIRILFEELRDDGLEGILLTGTLTGSRGPRRCEDVLGDRSSADVEMTGDLARRPVLGPVAAEVLTHLDRGWNGAGVMAEGSQP